jgi:hypothetical protein
MGLILSELVVFFSSYFTYCQRGDGYGLFAVSQEVCPLMNYSALGLGRHNAF